MSRRFSLPWVLIALMSSAGFPAFAATSVTIVISGIVASTAEVSIKPIQKAVDLSADVPASVLPVATVQEVSNCRAGYILSLSSSNDGELRPSKAQSSAHATSVPYTLHYGESTVSLTEGPAIISRDPTKAKAPGASKVLSISVSGSSAIDAQYGDTLTLTISAN